MPRSLPIRKIIYPACLQGQPNGRLGSDLLVDTPGLAGGPVVRLVAPAALAWRALTAAASTDGITLKATSLLDSYRPYSIQERIFLQRYTLTRLAGRPTRQWEGRTYWQKPGTAAAAVPGTSNHGLGLAVDCGTELDGDAGTESIDDRTLAWLLEHAADYGWSWELQSEPWHLRYVAGDVLIAPPEDDIVTDADIEKVAQRVKALLMADDALGPVRHHVAGSADQGARLPRVLRDLVGQARLLEAIAEKHGVD